MQRRYDSSHLLKAYLSIHTLLKHFDFYMSSCFPSPSINITSATVTTGLICSITVPDLDETTHI